MRAHRSCGTSECGHCFRGAHSRDRFVRGRDQPAPISVHGRSDQLKAHVQVRQKTEHLILEQIDARLDANTLTTGMGLRDQHMRNKIFATSDGSLPELRFTGERAVCPWPAAGQVSACEVSGRFFLRGVDQPFRIALKIRADGKQGSAYRVVGEGRLRLSAYGIEAPAQLGIRMSDEVKVRVEMLAQRPWEARARQ